MAEMKKYEVITAPVPKADDYTLSADFWENLTHEIILVSGRINAGEELVPDDVAVVRSLVKQVDDYLKTFNSAMRDAQAKYKALLEKQLNDLGYPVINNYILKQRNKQTNEQNARIAQKQSMLSAIVNEKIAATSVLKTMEIAGQLLPAFTHRFPKVNSGAKSNDVGNWGPYETIIGQTVKILDVFFADPAYADAKLLPITSATMQALLAYVRDGDPAHITAMREVFSGDAAAIEAVKLSMEITTKEKALAKISEIIGQALSTEQKLKQVSAVMKIAERL